AGRMGRTVCDAVEADPDLELVARMDPSGGDGIATSIDALLDANAEVAVDFTQPASVMKNIRWLVSKGIHAVVGTTGLSPADLEEIRGLEGANVFVAPNYSIGAVLMMHLSKQAAKHLGSCEVIEMHHNQK